VLFRSRGVFKRIACSVWQLPKALWLVLFFSLLFNFYSGFSKNTTLKEYISKSGAYQFIDNTAIDPLLRSDVAKQIPVFIDETVSKAVESLSHEGKKMLIKVYINGVTVEDAVVSSPEIDNLALDLVGTKTDDKVKAHILYTWVSENIQYDYDKAEIITTDIFAEPSGATVAYETRTGVCFDKACLYVAMCRAAGVPVRLITGLSYNGSEWCDHSWNQIYYDKDDRWISVDPTFGKENCNYFDRPDFWEDHKDEDIQGEW
jgi:transglutaminase-like putative cysteine protease